MFKSSSHNLIKQRSTSSKGSSNDYFLYAKFKPKKNKIQLNDLKTGSNYHLNPQTSSLKQSQQRTRSRTHSKQSIGSLHQITTNKHLLSIKSSKNSTNAEKNRSQTLPGQKKTNMQSCKQQIDVENQQGVKQIYHRCSMVLQAYQLKFNKLVEENKRVKNQNIKLKKKLSLI